MTDSQGYLSSYLDFLVNIDDIEVMLFTENLTGFKDKLRSATDEAK